MVVGHRYKPQQKKHSLLLNDKPNLEPIFAVDIVQINWIKSSARLDG